MYYWIRNKREREILLLFKNMNDLFNTFFKWFKCQHRGYVHSFRTEMAKESLPKSLLYQSQYQASKDAVLFFFHDHIRKGSALAI